MEEAPTTKTLHLQIFIKFHDPKRFTYFKKWRPEFHVEPCHNQNAANNYCGKPETRVEGPWEFGELKAAGGDKK